MKPRIAITTQHSRDGLLRYLRVQRNYADSVDAAGGIPLFLPQIADVSRADEYLQDLDGLLLSGGQDISPLTYDEEPHAKLGPVDPERDRWEIALYHAARKRQMPVLGICRGIQLMAVAEGGTLYQDIAAQAGSSTSHFPAGMPMESLHHRVNIQSDSLLGRIRGGGGEMTVNSFHHQAVKSPGRAFAVTAVSTSDNIIEAMEDLSAAFVLGIQYHAEALPKVDPRFLDLFRAFVQAAAE